jgi:hypothetical protein
MIYDNMLAQAVDAYQRLFPQTNNMAAGGAVPSIDQAQEVLTPTLSEMIAGVQPIPPKTCIVGLCSDHVPFLLDLTRAETGSLLVTSDPACGKTEHLRALAESAIRLNSPHEVQIAVITNDPDEWADLRDTPGYSRYFVGVYAWYEQGASDLVNYLVSLGEDRASGRHPGATVLLLVDDLSGVFTADFEIQNGMHWLLEYGPYSQIRPVASMDAQLCPPNPFWVDTFRTFLVGRIASDSLAESLGLSGVMSTKDLVPYAEFSAFTGETWTKYRLPMRD